MTEENQEQVKPKRTKKTVESTVTAQEQKQAEYDLYKLYQDYFEEQQRQVLFNWTQVMNNIFWWTKK